jgi:hypothetical protein
MHDIVNLENRHTFMAAVADKEKYLFLEARDIIDPYGGWIKEEWLEEIKKFGGWPSTTIFDYTMNVSNEEYNKLEDYRNGQGEMPVEFIEKVFDLRIEDSNLSYMNVKVGRFD